jgi:hypothetical protein
MATYPRSRLALDPLEGRDTPSGVAPSGEVIAGGVQSARADVTGDGTPDLVTAPGVGTAPTVKVYDGATGAEVASFDAYESSFTGGVQVAVADLNGDGKAEVITGADLGGGPRVRVLDGASVVAGEPVALIDFLAIEDENFRGGVRVATGDVTGDGVADLVVGAGEGGGPRVAGFDGVALGRGEVEKPFTDFFTHDPGLRHGARVSVEDVTEDGIGDLVFGAAPGAGLRDRFVNGAHLQNLGGDDSQATPVYEFFVSDIAYPEYDAAGNRLAEMIPYIKGDPPLDLSGTNPTVVTVPPVDGIFVATHHDVADGLMAFDPSPIMVG